jgi:hypothetical protein
MGILELQ